MELKIASCCGKPVDVLTMNGTKLRCPCGKALMDAPQEEKTDARGYFQGLRETTDALKFLSALRTGGVSRFDGYGISVSFHAEQQPARTGFMQDMLKPAVTQRPEDDEEACTCGHKIITDHGMTGCYHGCEMSTCGRQGTASDDA